MRTLVLNAGFEPLSVVSFKRAVVLVLAGKATVLADTGETLHSPGSLRQVDYLPRFAVGQRVRAKNVSVPGHTRMPRYIRGHSGVVDIIQPAALLPDTHAHFLGENPQHVYTVRFSSRELFGDDAEPFNVTIEMFESYLENVA